MLITQVISHGRTNVVFYWIELLLLHNVYPRKFRIFITQNDDRSFFYIFKPFFHQYFYFFFLKQKC